MTQICMLITTHRHIQHSLSALSVSFSCSVLPEYFRAIPLVTKNFVYSLLASLGTHDPYVQRKLPKSITRCWRWNVVARHMRELPPLWHVLFFDQSKESFQEHRLRFCRVFCITPHSKFQRNSTLREHFVRRIKVSICFYVSRNHFLAINQHQY